MTDHQPANLELHIEELVLHGFEHVDRAQIGSAVQHELSRLVAEGGVPRSLAHSGEIANLDGGEFDLAPGSEAGRVGAQVAQAVYGSLQQ